MKASAVVATPLGNRVLKDQGKWSDRDGRSKEVDMWRQGDIYIMKIDGIPKGVERRDNCVLAEGEATGHKHQVVDLDTAELYEKDGTLYLNVKAQSGTVTHDEHGPITLQEGSYKVWRQREYAPGPVRTKRQQEHATEDWRYVGD